MKKAKTILASIIVLIASIFIGACSCNGGGDAPQIYVTDIDIRLVTEKSSSTVTYEIDSNSGILDVYCHVEDVFAIEYNLTPANATVTQVNWNISDSQIVRTKSDEAFRSKSTTEIVDFVAVARSVERYKATITFSANITEGGNTSTYKQVKCNVYVYDKITELPVFVEPENIDYNNTTGKITWDRVTHLITASGNKTIAELNNGIPKNLSGYELCITNLDTGAVIIPEPVPATVTEYSGLESGINYDIKVKAIGDGNRTIKDSEYSDSFKMYKLNEVTNLANDNGKISYTTPDKSNSTKVYYYGYGEANPYIVHYTTANSTSLHNLNDTSKFNVKLGDLYTIQVVSFPESYDESNGYAEIDGVNYYPSTAKNKLVVQRLSAPTVDLEDVRTPITVGGVLFGKTDGEANKNPHTATRIFWSLEKNYEQQFKQKFRYKIDNVTDEISGSYVETTDTYLLISDLDDNKQYTITVETIGDSSNTISSGSDEGTNKNVLTFHIAKNFDGDDVLLNENDNDIIEYNENVVSAIRTNGMELFFVYQGSNAVENSHRIELNPDDGQDAFNISKLGLAAGEYIVYGKGICEITDAIKVAVKSPANYEQLMRINVASKVSDVNLNNQGIVTFTSSSDIKKFKVTFEDSKILSSYRIEVNVLGPLSNEANDDGAVHYEILETDNNMNTMTVRFNLIQAIRYGLAQSDVVINSGDPDGVLESLYSNILDSGKAKFIIQAKGNMENLPNNIDAIISSSPTRETGFYRIGAVGSGDGDTIFLNNNKLVFNRVGNNDKQKYILGLEIVNPDDNQVVNSYTFTHNGIWNIDSESGKVTTSLDVDDTVLVGGETKTLIDLIDTNKYNWIKIITVGNSCLEGGTASFNSIETKVKFNVTNTPTSLSLNQEGKLTWATTTEDITDYRYEISFFKVTFDNDEEQFEVIKDFSGNIKTQTAVGVNYSNISSILNSYPDEVIAVRITEKRANMFSNVPSEFFYGTSLSSPVLKYTLDENNQLITWASINNADYYNISAFVAGNNTAIYTLEKTSDTFMSITDRLNDGFNSWTEGVYTIKVVAGSDSDGVNSYDNPYVINSSSGNKEVTIVSGIITASVNNNSIVWDNIAPGQMATYSISYTLSDGQTTGIINDSKLFAYYGDNTKLILSDVSLFTSGFNMVTVTPAIDYEKYGYIILPGTKNNTITKWQAPTNLSTYAGNLTFRVYGAEDTDVVDFEFYQYDESKQGFKLITSGYSVQRPQEINNDGAPYLLYTVVLDGISGDKDLQFAVKVKSLTKLTSAISSTITADKIATITQFSKSGDYLTWDISIGTDNEGNTIYQDGISYFELYYKHSLDEVSNKITLKVVQQEDEARSYKCYTLANESTNTFNSEETPAIFYYSAGKFYYAFDYEQFIAGKTGDFIFTIRPLTDVDGFFNGNTSGPLTITKLNNSIGISVSQGKINITDYNNDLGSDNIPDSKNVPTRYSLVINKLELVIDTSGDVEVNTYNIIATKTITGIYDMNTSPCIAPIDLNKLGSDFEETGIYNAVLTLLGEENNDNVIDSDAITSVVFEKLSTSNLTTVNGVITWANALNAESYTIEINDGIKQVVFDIDKGSEKTIIDPSQTYTYTESKEVIDEQTGEKTIITENKTFTFEPGKTYTIKIKSNSDSEKNKKLQSTWSKEFKVKKLLAPTAVVISGNKEPFQITVSEKDGEGIVHDKTYTINQGTPIISWNNDNVTTEALNYILKYSNSYSVNIPEPTLLKYPLTSDLEVSTYTLQLQLIGNSTSGTSNIGLLTSDFSVIDSRATVDYVADVKGITVSEGVVTWGEIKGAYSYKVSAYDRTAYTNYMQNGGNEPSPAFSTYTTSNAVNFSNFAIDSTDSLDGNYIIVVNAITDPVISVVSTHSSTKLENTANIYQPSIIEGFKVKNGYLCWTISVDDISSFVEANSDKLAVKDEEGFDKIDLVIDYVLNKINLNQGSNNDLEAQIKHLINIKLNINGVETIDTPHSAICYDGINEITTKSNYSEADYIEFMYDVSINPEITNLEDESQLKGTNTAGVIYYAGQYNISLSAVGNSSTSTPVINGSFGQTITAYKPTTPKTWVINSSDINNGQVQWGLSTTPNSTLEEFEYYKNYKITAIPMQGDGIAYTTVNVDDKPQNLKNGYQYFRDFANDLFTLNPAQQATNGITIDYYYKLRINTVGTADSTLLANDELIYLNSNVCHVSAMAGIPSSSAFSVKDSKITWKTGISTKTKLYVYGPFDNINSSLDGRNGTWSNDTTIVSNDILDNIYNCYVKVNDPYIQTTTQQERDYAKLLTILEFGENNNGARINEFTFTDNINFASGGYIIKHQEIGDGKGIIDSEITSIIYNGEGDSTNNSKYCAVEKLGNIEPYTSANGQTSYWVGTESSNIFVWSPSTDKWSIKAPTSELNETIGTFMWKYVAGANAYRVELFSVLCDANGNQTGEAQSKKTYIVRENRFEMPSDRDLNDSNCKYFIRITAIRTVDATSTELANNFFSGDYRDSSAHYRIAIPTNLSIRGDGGIEWNSGVENASIGSYRVQFNYGLNEELIISSSTETNKVPEIYLGSGNQNGTIAIAVRAIAVSVGDNSALLNSSYCNSVVVTRLADPNVRLVDGVFNWGTGSTPLTSSNLTIDGESYSSKIESTDTSIKYFTDITAHNKDYTSDSDVQIYPTGSHIFTVQFTGTEGIKIESSNEDFYIASNIETLTAYKLDAPVISNVRLDIANTSENMVQWSPVSNALGYRVKVFYSNSSNVTTKEISIEELEDLLTENDDDNNFAVAGTTAIQTIYFKLDHIIETSSIKNDGGNIYIYVQALGSGIYGQDAYMTDSEGNTNTLYLSSSYSTSTTIGIPPQPESIAYDSTTGILTWNVDSDSAYGIKLVNSYTVEDVTENDFNNYWKTTSNELVYGTTGEVEATNDNATTPYNEIINRTVEYSLTTLGNERVYKLLVIDTLYLPTIDGIRTPTSYKLTTVGTDYRFTLTAISFTGEEENSDFASKPITVQGQYDFTRFGSGDGSENYPYTISNYTQLDDIRKFTDRDFRIINDINLVDDSSNIIAWNIIAGEFTGTLDGGNYKISNYTINNILSDDTAIFAFVESNSGIIKNLNIEANIKDVEGRTGLKVAPIAIYNNNTIDNVNISGTINITSANIYSAQNGSSVGGIVVENNGSISNSSVNATIIALEKTSVQVFAGGIARTNNGSISTTNFAGTITSNYIGGIVASNYGNIDKCFVDNATINVTDSSDISDSYKAAVVGGIIGEISENGSLTNSYSKAVITIYRGNATTASMSVGGLIGSIANESRDAKNIMNNYVITRISKNSNLAGNLSTSNLSISNMMPTPTNALNNSLVKNNYYIVESNIVEIEDTVTGVTKCADLTSLKNALKSLGVYNVDTEYPTLNQ